MHVIGGLRRGGLGVLVAPPARDRRSAPASPDRVCACLSRSSIYFYLFFAMIEDLLFLLLRISLLWCLLFVSSNALCIKGEGIHQSPVLRR